MEDIKLIIDEESVGSVSVDSNGIISNIFIHKTVSKETLEKISENDPLGEKINSEKYHIIET